MISGAVVSDDVFDGLASVCNFAESLVFSRTNTILPSLTTGLKHSIGYGRAFSAVYGWDRRALSKNLVRFERLVEFVIRFLDGFGAFGVESKKGIRRLFSNDTANFLLSPTRNPDIFEIWGYQPLDHFLSGLFEPGLNARHIDIFPPCILALARRLLVLLRCFFRLSHDQAQCG